MPNIRYYLLVMLLCPLIALTQIQQKSNKLPTTINFISDTQQPMQVEQIVLKSNQNTKATSLLFSDILKNKPSSLYMLGDVVSLGYRTNRWRKVDLFLDSCKKENIAVYGLLGNHDVMGRKNKGERNFNKRFPDNIRTGYISITDSVAVILLNSNFSKLSGAEKRKQLNWYKSMLKMLDKNDAVKAIIVTCHHAPYTNSIIVGSSNAVQQSFVPDFMDAKKAQLFITGHAHAFEHFNIKRKHFLVIGGGGGLHQPLNNSTKSMLDLAADYKPFFHYLSIQILANQFQITSHFLKEDFSEIVDGHNFSINF